MENIIKISNFKLKLKVKSILVIITTGFLVSILFLRYFGQQTLANILTSIVSSLFGIGGGYYASKKIDINNERNKSLSIRNNLLNLIKTEIDYNGDIFDACYNQEKGKDGPLNLKLKMKFKISDWESLKFKIFTEGIEILNKDGFTELCELYKRFEKLNLQKELNNPVNETSKNNMLNYIYDHLNGIENHVRAN
ncbi:hypothetical protein [Clostridium sp.]|uniref:hypothetical protein n=1 Tax=Clostridium sp. TaxID=1506 RepID=UPI00260D14CD|nr:hypothetical protein [uncultured Clostridium sp.]